MRSITPAGGEFHGVCDGEAGDHRIAMVQLRDDVAYDLVRNERAGGIVDQHPVGPDPGQRLHPQAAGILPVGSPGDGLGEVHPLGGGGKEVLVPLADHGLDVAHVRVGQKRLKCPADHGFSADQLVLFGDFAPRAQAAAARNDDRCH